MSSIEQGAGVLQAAAKEISDAQNDLTAIAASLRGQVEPMAAKWQGAGANAFFQFHDAWHEKEKKIVDILTNLSNGIAKTHETTAEVDAEQNKNYNNMLSRLDG